jgi:hypothetical protein
MNAYQIIPGIMNTLLERLKGVLRKSILNQPNVKRVIAYVSRYCYATRGSPFNNMHVACTDYNIKYRTFLNQCKGDDVAIPVSVMLVFMYNVCYTFQTDHQKNLLILALQGLKDHQEAISDKAFIHTFSNIKPFLYSTSLLNSSLTRLQILYQLLEVFLILKNFPNAMYWWDQIACHGTSVMPHSSLQST